MWMDVEKYYVSSSLSYPFSLGRMFRCIVFTMLLWRDHFKRLIIPKHGKNDVADFMHDSPNSHIFLFAFAFVDIVAMDNRVYRYFRILVNLKVIKRHHMQDASGKAGSPLGHMYFVPIKFAGLFYRRIQTKVGIKLFRGRKQVKGTHFCNQHNSAEKTYTPQGLEQLR